MIDTVDTVNQIKILIETSGKTAPEMTKALKTLGGGNMQKGIAKMADFCFKEGIKIGMIRGAIVGVVGTAAVGGLILLVRKAIKNHQLHKEEGEAILKVLEDSFADCEEDDNSEPTHDTTGENEQR